MYKIYIRIHDFIKRVVVMHNNENINIFFSFYYDYLVTSYNLM